MPQPCFHMEHKGLSCISERDNNSHRLSLKHPPLTATNTACHLCIFGFVCMFLSLNDFIVSLFVCLLYLCLFLSSFLSVCLSVFFNGLYDYCVSLAPVFLSFKAHMTADSSTNTFLFTPSPQFPFCYDHWQVQAVVHPNWHFNTINNCKEADDGNNRRTWQAVPVWSCLWKKNKRKNGKT